MGSAEVIAAPCGKQRGTRAEVGQCLSQANQGPRQDGVRDVWLGAATLPIAACVNAIMGLCVSGIP